MQDPNDEPKAKKIKPIENNEKKLSLFIKPTFSKKPWYTGGKVCLSFDGTRVYCIQDGCVNVVEYQQIIHTLAVGDDVVSFALAVGPQTLATCSRKGLIRIFKPHEIAEVRNFSSQNAGTVTEMDFDPTGECLATGSADHAVKVFSCSGGYITHNFRGHKQVISAMKFHPNEGNLILATADISGVIIIWNLRNKQKTIWLNSHMSAVTSLSFLNQNILVSVGRDRILSVWSFSQSSTTPLKTIPVFESLECSCSIDSQHFVTGGSGGVLKKWKFDAKSNECVLVDSQQLPSALAYLTLCYPNASEANKACVVTVSSQEECLFTFRSIGDLGAEVMPRMIGLDDEIFDCILLSPTKFVIATTSSLLRMYELLEGEHKNVSVRMLPGHTSSVISLAHSAAHGFFVSGSKDQTIRLWSTESLEVLAVGEGHTHSIGAIACAHKQPLVASGSDDCNVRVWRVNVSKKSLECIDQRACHAKPVLDVAFSPNDQLLATCSQDKLVKIWTMANDNGQFQSLKCELKGHKRAVNSVNFSWVDRVVCSASADTTVKVWAIADGSCVRTLQSHSAPVTSALFASSGTSLLSASSDGSIKTWDLKSSLCEQTIQGTAEGGHDDRIWALTSHGPTMDDEMFISVGVNGHLVMWKNATKEEIERKRLEKTTELLNKEKLEKSLREKKYLEAAKLALLLNRLHQLRSILENSHQNQAELNEFITSLLLDEKTTVEQCAAFLSAVAKWNSLGRTCEMAQKCIASCFAVREKLEQKIGKPSLFKFVQEVAPYSNRHLSRIDGLIKNAFLLEQ